MISLSSSFQSSSAILGILVTILLVCYSLVVSRSIRMFWEDRDVFQDQFNWTQSYATEQARRRRRRQSTVTFQNKDNNDDSVAATTTTTTSNQLLNQPQQQQSKTTTTTNNDSILRIPNLLIAGAQKGGTSSIAKYLVRKTDTCEARHYNYSNGKEAHFFDHLQEFEYNVRNYQKFYDKCIHATMILDGTPEIMFVPKQVHDIYQQQQELLIAAAESSDKTIEGTNNTDTTNVLKSLKIIFSLREPVDREFSWYNHRVRDIQKILKQTNNDVNAIPDWLEKHIMLRHNENENKTTKTTTTTTTKIELNSFGRVLQHSIIPNVYNTSASPKYRKGLYATYLKEWFRYFDRSQILILSFDELLNDKETMLRRIHDFLQLPIEKKLRLPKINESSRQVQAKQQKLKQQLRTSSNEKDDEEQSSSCQIQTQLAQMFEAPNQELYDLLEQYPGPEMEQRPFPRFNFTCH